MCSSFIASRYLSTTLVRVEDPETTWFLSSSTRFLHVLVRRIVDSVVRVIVMFSHYFIPFASRDMSILGKGLALVIKFVAC